MSFGLRYWAELRSKYKEVFWRVEIDERGYSGSSEEMAFDGANPLQITWERRGDEFYVPIKGSEATINILCHENFHYINLFTSDPRKFRISIYRNTKLYWRGYVVADLYSEKFTAPPYQVSIKAVDGFSLLANIPYINLDNTPITGRRSVWELLYSSIELLELDVDIADWMDLYAEGMDESSSPLGQVYIEMERFYVLYSEPTYRDVLELCLRPFAGQIFQSNGALHIRRAISLYQDKRPMSFYSVGRDFPVGWLITSQGDNIINSSGEPLITESTRECIESMWNSDINVQGDSTMDIAPPLRKVAVGVKNKMITNIIEQMGIYNLDNWIDSNKQLSLYGAESLRFLGDSDHQGEIVSFNGYSVKQCSYALRLEYTLKVYANSYSALGGGQNPTDKALPVEYGFKVVGDDTTYWLNDEGVWCNEQTSFTEDISVSTESTKEIEIKGFPINGKFIFYIKQTLKGYIASRNSYSETLYINNMRMEMDAGDDYADSINYQTISNPANNVDMSVELPIADIPNIPNDKLIYSLYFTDSDGVPTRMWHTKGGNDYNTLVNHITSCALKYRQLPARRINGEMFTGKHIDMNSVVQDDKYLMAGFYVNSIELNCLNDSYNSELVEMPGLLLKETPPDGDDCIKLADLNFTVKKALKCVNKIVLLSSENSIYTYDITSGYLTHLFEYSYDVDIFPADNSFTVVDGSSILIVDYRGVTIHRLDVSGDKPYSSVATYMNRYLYKIAYSYNRGSDTIRYRYLIRPEYKYTSNLTFSTRGDIGGFTELYEDVVSLEKSFSTIAINTTSHSYLHDCRVNQDVIMTPMEEFTEIKSVSDYFICMNGYDVLSKNRLAEFRIYRRDSLTEMTCVKYIPNHVQQTDHTLNQVAYSQSDVINIWQYRSNTITLVKNLESGNETTKALLYINGELYIVRETKIYKYIQ